MIALYSGNFQWEEINELPHLLQNQHPKIKFIMEPSSKELPFLDKLMKT